MDDAVAVAEDLAVRPFSTAAADTSDWLEGVAQRGARAHFAAIAVFESLHETPADHDGTAWRLWEQAYAGFEQYRRDVAAVLTVRWGPPQPFAFRTEYERVTAGDETVSPLEYDLAMFTGGEQFPAWRHEDRIVALLLGQMDKEFPIVLTIAAIALSG